MALTQHVQAGTGRHRLAEEASAVYFRCQDAYRQAQTAYARVQATWGECQVIMAAASAHRRRAGAAAGGHRPQHPPDARLLDRLATMPAIEQAKGIIMAQSGCSADQAFGRLRRASQRLNVPVRDLAVRVIASVAPSAQSQPAGAGES